MAENVKVAVRVRPFNQREKDREATLVIGMEGNTTRIKDPKSGEEREFNFDFSYWSHDGFKERADGYLEKSSPSSRYADQSRVFQDLGKGILINAWDGYNSTLFAYGQTGSGKSYSIVGNEANKGIVPVFADRLFSKISEKQGGGANYEVEFSMLEIYNEKARDLLNPKTLNLSGGLKVRENPARGFYVEGLQTVAVENYKDIEARMAKGMKNRAIAATKMNATSSRAHTIVGIKFVQKSKNKNGEEISKTSIIKLVDLAGSERVSASRAKGDRLKEGAAINLSLSMLGNVISALAVRSSSKKKVRVPYRDSVLTKLLKNALGGNSKTVMIAALSPAHINHGETLSTLRYADRAKQIKTVAKVNEDPTAKLIRELQEENARLKALLQQGGAATVAAAVATDEEELTEKQKEEMRKEYEDLMNAAVQDNERKMKEMEQTWEEKLRVAHEMYGDQQQNEEMRKKMKTTPHLGNLHADPQLTNVIIHFIEKGKQYLIGKPGEKTDIEMSGVGIEDEHAILQCVGDKNIFIKIVDPDAKVRFNGELLAPDDSRQIRHNDRLLFGSSHLYVFADPAQNNASPQSFSEVTYEMAQDEISTCIGLSSAEKKSKDEAVIRETLAELRPAVDEANSISEALDQKVKFDILVVPPHYRGVDSGHTEIMVRMSHLENGMSWVWTKEEFINKKFIMQELYEDTEPGKKPSLEYNPFVEDISAEVMIGSAVVSPQCLAYMIGMRTQFTIVGYGGEAVGVLNGGLIPCDFKGKEIKEDDNSIFIDDPKDLLGKTYKVKVNIDNARGIPKRFKEVFVKYEMFLETGKKTKVVSGTNNPEFGFSFVHEFKPATAELLSWLRNGNLIFQVWGKQQPVTGPARRRLNTKQLRKTVSLTADVQVQPANKGSTVDKLMKGILQRRCDNLENKLHGMRVMIKDLEDKKVKNVKIADMKKVLNAKPDADARIDELIQKIVNTGKDKADSPQKSELCYIM